VQFAQFRPGVGAELVAQLSLGVLVVRDGVGLPPVADRARMSCPATCSSNGCSNHPGNGLVCSPSRRRTSVWFRSAAYR
jgi:hypothetical protein